jgi:hypothetical protein
VAITLGTTGAGTLKRYVVGNRKTVIATITGDTSYPTGGSALTPAQLGLRRVDYADTPQAVGGVSFTYDYANNKLLSFTGGTQTTNATNQSAISVRMRFEGQ